MSQNRQKKYFPETIRGGEMTTRSNDNTRVIKIGSAISTTSCSSYAGASSNNAEQSHSEYSLVRVEQLDQTAALQQQRANSWRYSAYWFAVQNACRICDRLQQELG
jgi:hypothetical protein